MDYTRVASDESITKAIVALKASGIEALVVANGAEAKAKVFEIIPQGAEVMTMSSVTLDTLGISKEINESGKYKAVKPKLYSMDRKTQAGEMQKLGAAPEWAIGSVHAVTEDGHVLIASATGSQLPAYAYGSQHVLWVVGGQKIVKNTDEGIQRIYNHSFVLENERAKKAYGMGSFVSKILIVNKEYQAGRMTMIIMKEAVGF